MHICKCNTQFLPQIMVLVFQNIVSFWQNSTNILAIETIDVVHVQKNHYLCKRNYRH